MTYSITVTNHDPITIDTGINDTSTSLTLIGKNVPNYGQAIAQNFVKLLQNFAGTSAPNGALDGQLYYDTNVNALRLCQGGEFRKVLACVSTTNGSTPTSNNVGDLWWDTSVDTLKLYNGSSWTSIGPYILASSASALPDRIIASNNVARDVIKFMIGPTTIMMVSQYSFVPLTPVAGFQIINAGLTFASNAVVPDNIVTGNIQAPVVTSGAITASTVNAGTIGNSGATLTGTLSTGYQNNITTVGTLSGLTVTANANFQSSVAATSVVSGATGSFATIEGNNLNLSALATVGNVITTNGVFWPNGQTLVSTITAFNGTVGATTPTTGVFTRLTTSGNITVNSTNLTTAIVNGGTNGTGNIGASGATFNTLFAKATTAQYADLAEKYHSDQVYAPGTVMKIGGINEITRCDEEYSYDVFGVISENPAYLMNDKNQSELWLPIVLVGRSSVNVIGPVSKGERLVSAGNGYAKASDKGVCFRTVIGRSLVNKTSEIAELIECYINTN
jgi:hypothetical protein